MSLDSGPKIGSNLTSGKTGIGGEVTFRRKAQQQMVVCCIIRQIALLLRLGYCDGHMSKGKFVCDKWRQSVLEVLNVPFLE